MSKRPYTDKEIQEYLDGSFTGDKKDLEQFIEQDLSAKKTLEFYKNLFLLISQKEDIDLPNNLPGKIVGAIQAKQNIKEKQQENFINIGLAVIAFVAIGGCLKNVIGTPNGVFETATVVVSSLIILVFSWVFTKIEIDRKKSIYHNLLSNHK
jgi:hypothetical protein